jgi:DNA-binding XRE family transcriptional regulator
VRVRANAPVKVHTQYVTVVSYRVNLNHAYFFQVKPNKSYADLCETVVRLLREERARQGVSKYAVEQRAGISQQMVGYVERGLRKPSLETALRMADALGLDLADVIKKARRTLQKRK